MNEKLKKISQEVKERFYSCNDWFKNNYRSFIAGVGVLACVTIAGFNIKSGVSNIPMINYEITEIAETRQIIYEGMDKLELKIAELQVKPKEERDYEFIRELTSKYEECITNLREINGIENLTNKIKIRNKFVIGSGIAGIVLGGLGGIGFIVLDQKWKKAKNEPR